MFAIYSLHYNGSDEPFYIGKTTVERLERRLNEHIYRAKAGASTFVARKVRKILKEGGIVTLVPLGIFTSEEAAHAAETAHIRAYGRINNKTGTLVNLTDGGEGVSGVMMPLDARKRMREAKLGNKLNVGRKRPDMVERYSKSVDQLTLDGAYIATFPSARAAHKETGHNYSGIGLCCMGRAKSTRKNNSRFTWKFSEEK